MLSCKPQSIFSWNYGVEGTSAGDAEVRFNHFTEQGGITLGNDEFAVQKHGMLSGHWSLMLADQLVADARKPNPLLRTFELDAAQLKFTLQASSAFTRAYDILDAGGEPVGRIAPDHVFTRHASIECGPRIPELEQLFAFWLVILTWKREADNESAANAMHLHGGR